MRIADFSQRFSVVFAALVLACLVSFSATAEVDAPSLVQSSRSGCDLVAVADGTTVESCMAHQQNHVVRLVFDRADQDLVINAQFESDSRNVNPMTGARFWEKLWVSSGDGRLTPKEQLTLRKLLSSKDPSFVSSDAHSLVDVLANLVEPGHEIESFDARTEINSHTFQSGSWLTPFLMICNQVGTFQKASFTVDELSHDYFDWVGDPGSRCLGRCGIGCAQFLQKKGKQYTQECFNHDLCTAVTQNPFGSCRDEFYTAAMGYVLAPDCE